MWYIRANNLTVLWMSVARSLMYSRNNYKTGPMTKPVPIMLLILPIIPSIIFAYYSYFIPMPSPIIPVIFFKFLLCQ